MRSKEQILDELDLNRQELDESFLVMFGNTVKWLLKSIFNSAPPASSLKIKGSPAQIDAFAKLLSGEKKYMDSFIKYGLDNPATYKSKSILDKAIRDFEAATKLKWIF